MFMKRMGRIGAVALILIAVAACKPPGSGAGSAADDLPTVGQDRMDEVHADCLKSGGSFMPNGGAFVCMKVPSDAGKRCEKADDCESACLARSRTCAPIKPLLGCEDVLTGSGMAVRQCVE